MKKLALIALLLMIPAMAQAKTLEDLLVEKGVISESEARAGVNDEDAKVYWHDGTIIEFPNDGFVTNIATDLQSSYAFTDVDHHLRDVGLARGNTSSFSVDRARLILSGSALYTEFKYKLEAEFAGDKYGDGDAKATMDDAYIQWEPCEHMGYRLGQFKTGVSRQYNTETYARQIPTQSVASRNMTMFRQGGARAFYGDETQDFTLYASIYNGESDNEAVYGYGEDRYGTDTRHAFDASARVNILGHMNPFEEGDINFTDDLALNVGTTYSYSRARNGFGDFDTMYTGDLHRQSIDANLKYQGFSFHGEFFWGRYKHKDFDDRGAQPNGFYAQAGYFLTPEFEVAARYSMFDCDRSFGGDCTFVGRTVGVVEVDDVNEAAVSLNYYFWKRNLKAQLAYIFENQNIYTRHREDFGAKDINTNIWMLSISAYL